MPIQLDFSPCIVTCITASHRTWDRMNDNQMLHTYNYTIGVTIPPIQLPGTTMPSLDPTH